MSDAFRQRCQESSTMWKAMLIGFALDILIGTIITLNMEPGHQMMGWGLTVCGLGAVYFFVLLFFIKNKRGNLFPQPDELAIRRDLNRLRQLSEEQAVRERNKFGY
jgi:hypothetical protein